jgi:hypothetical protein
MSEPPTEFRFGNRALEFVFARCDTAGEPISAVLKSLLPIARNLSSLVNGAAKKLVRENLVDGNISLSDLADCVTDLALTVYLEEAVDYLRDKEIASVFTDALLFEITGKESTSPDEMDFLIGETHTKRGVHKHQLAAQRMPHIPDASAWLFGSEAAALQGQFRNIGITLSLRSFTVMLRAFVRSDIQLTLRGIPPNPIALRELEKKLAAADAALAQRINDSH